MHARTLGENGQLVDDLLAMQDVASGNYSYVHQNRQGSTIAISNDSGVVPTGEEYKYASYGAPDHAGAFPFQYTGRRYDPETGFYYYRARMYDAELGRFLQTDPIGYEDQINLYAYVRNDPLTYTDPTGMVRFTLGLSAKLTAKVGLKGGVAVSYDTEGHTLGVKGEIGGRTGAAAGVKAGFQVDQSNGFAKSDVKVGVAVDAEASAVVAKGKVEGRVELSARDGLSASAGPSGSVGVDAVLDPGDVGGGAIDLSAGADAGVTGSVEVSVSGTEIVNGINDGINYLAEKTVEFEQGLKCSATVSC